MSVFLVHIDKRDDDGEIFGVYYSREGAVRAVREYACKRFGTEALKALLEEFDGDLEEGRFSTEEQNVYIVERLVLEDDVT